MRDEVNGDFQELWGKDLSLFLAGRRPRSVANSTVCLFADSFTRKSKAWLGQGLGSVALVPLGAGVRLLEAFAGVAEGRRCVSRSSDGVHWDTPLLEALSTISRPQMGGET